jgi:hypothetical protein
MAGGLFVTDCSSTDWAWLDLGCTVQNIGTDLGQGITNLLMPVWIILAIVAILIVIILFAPNTKHIIPHLTFL